jgi:hypothetical protein
MPGHVSFSWRMADPGSGSQSAWPVFWKGAELRQSRQMQLDFKLGTLSLRVKGLGRWRSS